MVLAILAICLLAPAAARAEVTLGSAAISSPYGEGFGVVAPSRVYNGGVPSGLVSGIEWSGWGGAVAFGSGRNPIYKPIGGYYPQRAEVRLKATSLGACPDQPAAYRKLLVRLPLWPDGPLGSWQSWTGNSSLCGDGEQIPWKPPGGGGYCGYTGEFEVPGEAKSIMGVRVDCRTARRVAAQSNEEVATSPLVGKRRYCGRRGCRVKMQGFRCRFHRAREVDFSDSEGEQLSLPFQRVACKRGRASIIFWYMIVYY